MAPKDGGDCGGGSPRRPTASIPMPQAEGGRWETPFGTGLSNQASSLHQGAGSVAGSLPRHTAAVAAAPSGTSPVFFGHSLTHLVAMRRAALPRTPRPSPAPSIAEVGRGWHAPLLHALLPHAMCTMRRCSMRCCPMQPVPCSTQGVPCTAAPCAAAPCNLCHAPCKVSHAKLVHASLPLHAAASCDMPASPSLCCHDRCKEARRKDTPCMHECRQLPCSGNSTPAHTSAHPQEPSSTLYCLRNLASSPTPRAACTALF
eukprot:362044-Chlamydomonas_euryale.AAC.14